MAGAGDQYSSAGGHYGSGSLSVDTGLWEFLGRSLLYGVACCW
jgi:hypothetical protein